MVRSENRAPGSAEPSLISDDRRVPRAVQRRREAEDQGGDQGDDRRVKARTVASG